MATIAMAELPKDHVSGMYTCRGTEISTIMFSRRDGQDPHLKSRQVRKCYGNLSE